MYYEERIIFLAAIFVAMLIANPATAQNLPQREKRAAETIETI